MPFELNLVRMNDNWSRSLRTWEETERRGVLCEQSAVISPEGLNNIKYLAQLTSPSALFDDTTPQRTITNFTSDAVFSVPYLLINIDITTIRSEVKRTRNKTYSKPEYSQGKQSSYITCYVMSLIVLVRTSLLWSRKYQQWQTTTFQSWILCW